MCTETTIITLYKDCREEPKRGFVNIKREICEEEHEMVRREETVWGETCAICWKQNASKGILELE